MCKTQTFTRRVMAAVPAGMLCVFLAAIFYLNFSMTPSFYITDMYTDVMVAVEMWEQKTVFPDGWIFGNQLYVLAPPVLAALFYGVTGNAFLGMAAASSVMTIFVLLSFDWMLRPVLKGAQERLFGAVVFLSVMLLFGDAVKTMNGWQLLFTMCSYYACYAVTAFLAFGCYLRSGERVPVGMTALACVLSFAMGIQSLRQTAVMTLPLLAAELLNVLLRLRRKESVKTGSFLAAAAIGALNFAGLLCGKLVQVEQADILGEISIASPEQMLSGVLESLKTAGSLFARDTQYENTLYRVVLLAYVLAAVILCIRMRNKLERKGRTLFLLFALSVLAIFGIDVVLTMEVRGIYYFMLLPLLGCLSAWIFAQGGKAVKGVMAALLCGVFCLACCQEVLPACGRARQRQNEESYSISAYLLENGYTTVYSSWNRCEKIAVASQGQIRAGFWTSNEDPFIPVLTLCSTEIYDAAGETAAYLFYGQEDAEAGLRKAESKKIELTFLGHFPERDVYLYTAPVNLLQEFSE